MFWILTNLFYFFYLFYVDTANSKLQIKTVELALREKCPKRSFFWSVFSFIRTEYRKIRTRKNSVFGHFSRSVGDNFVLLHCKNSVISSYYSSNLKAWIETTSSWSSVFGLFTFICNQILKLTYCASDNIMFVIIGLFLFGDVWLVLTHYSPVLLFYTPGKHQKI